RRAAAASHAARSADRGLWNEEARSRAICHAVLLLRRHDRTEKCLQLTRDELWLLPLEEVSARSRFCPPRDAEESFTPFPWSGREQVFRRHQHSDGTLYPSFS